MSKLLEDKETQTEPLKSSTSSEAFEGTITPTEATKPETSEESRLIINETSISSKYKAHVMEKSISDDCPLNSQEACSQEPDSMESYTGPSEYLAQKSVEASNATKEENNEEATAESERGVAKPEAISLVHNHEKGFPENFSDNNESPINESQCTVSLDLSSNELTKQTVFRQASDNGIHGTDSAAYTIGTKVKPLQKRCGSLVLKNKLSQITLPFEDHKTERAKAINSHIDSMLLQGQDFKHILYCLAPELYRQHQSTSVCPLCLCTKEDDGTGAHPLSHIFPRCMLEEYKKIHCKNYEDNFIYDAISGSSKGYKALVFPIFCHNCELKGGTEEGMLKEMYLEISGAESQELVMPSEKCDKVKHILAVILFRGSMIGIDFLKEIDQSEKFFECFENLQKFCHGGSNQLSNFYVFIAGNKHYKQITNYQEVTSQYANDKYYIEFQLRNPQFTKMVGTEYGDVFMYTKFDCFHCVLMIEANKIILPNQDKPFHPFPDFLWLHNLREVGKFTAECISLSQHYGIIIQDPLNPFIPDIPLPFEIIPAEDQRGQAESTRMRRSEALRQIARSNSPLAMVDCQDSKTSDLEEEIKTLKNRMKTVQSLLNKKKKDLKEATTEKLELQKENKQLQKRINTLTEEVTQLEDEIEQLKKENIALQEKKHMLGVEQLTLDSLSINVDEPVQESGKEVVKK